MICVSLLLHCLVPLTLGAIIGIVVGVVGGILLIAFIIILLLIQFAGKKISE
jgi:hypothetical protein